MCLFEISGIGGSQDGFSFYVAITKPGRVTRFGAECVQQKWWWRISGYCLREIDEWTV